MTGTTTIMVASALLLKVAAFGFMYSSWQQGKKEDEA